MYSLVRTSTSSVVRYDPSKAHTLQSSAYNRWFYISPAQFSLILTKSLSFRNAVQFGHSTYFAIHITVCYSVGVPIGLPNALSFGLPPCVISLCACAIVSPSPHSLVCVLVWYKLLLALSSQPFLRASHIARLLCVMCVLRFVEHFIWLRRVNGIGRLRVSERRQRKIACRAVWSTRPVSSFRFYYQN